MKIDETAEGAMHFGTNELKVDSKYDDPSKVRTGAPGHGSLGAWSGDELPNGPDGQRLERTLIIMKGHNPHSPNDAQQCGAIDLFCALEGRTDDAGMIRVMTLTPHALYVFVPIVTAVGEPVPGPSPTPPPPPPPPPPVNPGAAVHGILPGDFSHLSAVYGFASDDRGAWEQGTWTYGWRALVERMDIRDGYAHFAPGAP